MAQGGISTGDLSHHEEDEWEEMIEELVDEETWKYHLEVMATGISANMKVHRTTMVI